MKPGSRIRFDKNEKTEYLGNFKNNKIVKPKKK